MGSKGIKTHITITLVILLAIGMFLTNLVVSTLWQQSLIRAEMNKTLSLLTAVADSITGKTNNSNEIFSSASQERLRKDLGASCIMLSINNVFTSIPENCSQETPVLEDRMKQVIETGVASSTTINTGPGLPFIGRKLLITVIPIKQQGTRGATGAVISLQSVADQIGQGRQIASLYILINVIILTTIGLFRLIKLVVRPIERLVMLSDTYQSEESNPFLSDSGNNEFGQLSIALNRMLHRIDNDRKKLRENVDSLEKANQQLHSTQQQMVQTEKMAAIGGLAAGLAHEIGNPIGIVQGYVEMLGQTGLSADEQKQFSHRSLQELERINRMIQQLLNFSRTKTDNSGSTAIHPLLQELVDMFLAQKKTSGLEFQLDLAARDDQVAAGADGLHQVFLNCLLNSVDAIKQRCDQHNHPAGFIRIATVNTSSDKEKPCIQITIQDNGIGIRDADRGKLFDPFFTTKEPGKGTGLGLSVSYALVESCQGKMRIQGEDGQGATVFILLPLQGKDTSII